MSPQHRLEYLQRMIVTAAQMRSIEQRIFDAGMPIAAVMEKVSGRLALRIQALYPQPSTHRIGVLVGPGHNGGDALVVARELYFQGYEIMLCCPVSRLKDLTATHLHYLENLGIACYQSVDPLAECDLLLDGLFGFGLDRVLTKPISTIVDVVNEWDIPRLSIDLPSGLHTDTGQVLGTAICATHTLCLGLWKLGLLQDDALHYVGQAELIDFDIPLADIAAVLGEMPSVQRVTPQCAIAALPLVRPASTHKYKMGHVLLICGSRRYAGGALLTGLGARASGVGMLSIAVPQSLKSALSVQLPEALIVGCPETEDGAIAELPASVTLSSFNAIACGPGLTTDATAVVEQVLTSECPLVLDADGLNIVAHHGTIPTLHKRQAPTVLTPHLGEFKRLFPEIADGMDCRVTAVQRAAKHSTAIVLLKGARVVISDPHGSVRVNPTSTPALARGGSGDVLTGLLGGLVAQKFAAPSSTTLLDVVQAGTWWHAQAGCLAARKRTELGVDAHTLTNFLIPALARQTQIGTE
ncbi:NAD(P)H-hydrate dehydratase [Myxacorys almedinensis A]|uniref:Bifunctional NAD(P)H-hydrate repair enzyme n=2 Tax=Myxacorys TaxID=2056239 RepID=A0A8J7YY94_9CYAN|nr:NAD(P)H-hydrate dehydratase [Myxacorys almedinensis]NDJ16314.1 NAD(P)H-hydrate dehydratase [Myxacorys almedinensis A]